MWLGGGKNLLECMWSFRVFSSNMPIDPQEMGSCCKFDYCGDLGHPSQRCSMMDLMYDVSILSKLKQNSGDKNKLGETSP